MRASNQHEPAHTAAGDDHMSWMRQDRDGRWEQSEGLYGSRREDPHVLLEVLLRRRTANGPADVRVCPLRQDHAEKTAGRRRLQLPHEVLLSHLCECRPDQV